MLKVSRCRAPLMRQQGGGGSRTPWCTRALTRWQGARTPGVVAFCSMCPYVCMHVCIYLFIYLSIYLSIYLHLSISIYLSINPSISTYTYHMVCEKPSFSVCD